MGVAQGIYKAFEQLQTACETITELGECGLCPMRANCLCDVKVSFGEAVYDTPLDAIKGFIAYADKLTDIGITKRG